MDSVWTIFAMIAFMVYATSLIQLLYYTKMVDRRTCITFPDNYGNFEPWNIYRFKITGLNGSTVSDYIYIQGVMFKMKIPRIVYKWFLIFVNVCIVYMFI